MAKVRTKRRMKKQVRKTLGALFLASSIAVAAIPTGSYEGGSASAADGHSSSIVSQYSVTVNDTAAVSGNIPQITTSTKIYTDESKAFEFAYIQDNDNNWVAVIVGYGTLSLQNGTLVIPSTFDAFTQYNTNSTNGELVAVGRNGNFLFYKTQKTVADAYDEEVEDTTNQARDASGRKLWKDSSDNRYYETTDDSSQTVYLGVNSGLAFPGTVAELSEVWATKQVHHDAVIETTFVPCYLDDINEWCYKKGGRFQDGELYYDNQHLDGSAPATDYTTEANFTLCGTNATYLRINEGAVAYISNQKATRNPTTGIWSYQPGADASAAHPENGVFANNANISTLKIEGTLVGIGDYAFYNCNGLNSLDLSASNGLSVIGPGAFSDCYQLRSVTFTADGMGTNLRKLGQNAFYNCRSLTNLVVPKSITTLGDSCFEGCVKLQNLDLCGGGDGGDAALREIGLDVFRGCTALSSLTFPWNVNGDILLSQFEGDTSLRYISTRNSDISFVPETGVYSVAEFQKALDDDNPVVQGEFYFEGFDISNLHQMAKEDCFAFHYIDPSSFASMDRWELTKKEEGDGKVTYIVNDRNQLQYPVNFDTTNGPVKSLAFPEKIGPYSISSIAENAFQNQCTLEKVVIPSTITSIGSSAFRGCHNLKYVIFNTQTVSIGEDAFKTQDFIGNHKAPCPTKSAGEGKPETEADNSPKVKLTFVGPIDASSTPFQYAMNANHNYNNDDLQSTSFIQYCSGWPDCLTVIYDYDYTTGTGRTELIDFPTMATLANFASADYLTDAQKIAASDALIALTDPTKKLTTAQEKFINAASELTIPTGIDGIKDGAFYEKTNDPKCSPMDIIIMGFGNIEASVNNGPKDANGLSVLVDPTKSDFAGCEKVKSIYITGGVPEIADYAFYGCQNLETIDISSGTTYKIGDYAFGAEPKLESASISANVSDLGLAPFVGDLKLQELDFKNSPYYKNENSVVYGLENGVPTHLVEVLPSRVDSYKSDSAISSLKSIAKDSFNTSQVKGVDLSGAAIATIPTHAFYNTKEMRTIVLPNGCKTVEKHAFEDSTVYEIDGTDSIMMPDAEMLDGIITSTGTTDSTVTAPNKNVTVVAPLDSYLYTYAVRYNYTVEEDHTPKSYTIMFYGYDDVLGNNTKEVDSQTLNENEHVDMDRVLYKVIQSYEDSLGNTFVMNGWTDASRRQYTNEEVAALTIDYDYVFYANYEVVDATLHAVVFNDLNGNEIKRYNVKHGNTLAQEEKDLPNMPDVTDVNGLVWTFVEWRPTNGISVLDPITAPVQFDPRYELKKAVEYTITYKDGDGNVVGTEQVGEGEYPKGISYSYEDSTKRFAGWLPDLSAIRIYQDYSVMADYTPRASEECIVTFQYIDPTDYSVKPYTAQKVTKGQAINLLNVSDPKVSGYTFNGWDKATVSPAGSDIFVVDKDEITLTGTFTPGDGGNGSGGGNGNNTNADSFRANYYDIDGNLYQFRDIMKGSMGLNIIKPEGYSVGYEWAPNPAETIMDDNKKFYLVPSDGVDTSKSYLVRYYYPDGVKVYETLEIDVGDYAPNLAMPKGYERYMWSPNPGETPITKDYRFTMVVNPDPFAEPEPSPQPNPNTQYYTLTVVNGSGSGTYAAGTQAIIVANEPAAGLMFGNWTISPDNAPIASKGLSATVITMPSENVTVTANYVTKTSSGGSGGNSGNGGSSGNVSGNNRPTTGGSRPTGGTTVVIDKNGLSNTGVVSATVNGSSDNFTVKVSESGTASEAVLKALLAQYGDISNIMYFPMDISLYDSTGTKKITDTTGLTVTITLPLPDSLAGYGGNNKVAAVSSSGQLENLGPKFTTISGVPCVTFTATHFSPYVIYVDTKNLSALGVNDTTPKTGDGIHPKWFLSIGLAAISLVLFLKKDKKKVIAA